MTKSDLSNCRSYCEMILKGSKLSPGEKKKYSEAVCKKMNKSVAYRNHVNTEAYSYNLLKKIKGSKW